MTAKIKVLHTSEKISRGGKRYRKVLVLITIGKNEFLNTFYIFD